MQATQTPTFPDAPDDLYAIYPDPWNSGGRVFDMNFHAGQAEAWRAGERFVAVLAGTQAGKTSWGPLWLHREIYGETARDGTVIHRGRGAGDYLAVTASYDLFKLKMLPAIREVFETVYGVGRYWSGDRLIELKDPATGRFWARRATDPMWGRIILRSAEAGSGLESSTAKGALLDEAGQDSFTGETWRAVQSRLSLNLGRALITTTLYNFGWLKSDFYDRWKAGDSDYRVVHFDSIDNPRFSRQEWDRARRSMPAWRFDLRYRGRYSRPAGLIYDSYADEPQPAGNICPRFEIPVTWDHYLGLDFGGVNTAAVALARHPEGGPCYAYREYLEGDRTAELHAAALLSPDYRYRVAVGGSPSEDQWRREFARGGLPVVAPPVSSVEVGINRVWGAFKNKDLIVFDDLTGLRKELTSYSRKLDGAGEPTEVIQDKERYHLCDSVRYASTLLFSPGAAEGSLAEAPDPRPAANARSGRSVGRDEDARRRFPRRGGF